MNRKRTGRFVALATSAFFVLAFAAPALAQTGQLKGKVVDQADKPVEGAKVTISAKQTKSSRDVKTNKRGEWIQIGLFPGDYTITAEKDGDKGNVDDFRAVWRLRAVDENRTVLKLEILVDPKLPLPASMVTPELAYAADKAVTAVRDRAEKTPTPQKKPSTVAKR